MSLKGKSNKAIKDEIDKYVSGSDASSSNKPVKEDVGGSYSMKDKNSDAVFDDWTENPSEEESAGEIYDAPYWTQVCDACAKKYHFKEDSLDRDAGHGICGVVGCGKESDHYYDFDGEKVNESTQASKFALVKEARDSRTPIAYYDPGEYADSQAKYAMDNPGEALEYAESVFDKELSDNLTAQEDGMTWRDLYNQAGNDEAFKKAIKDRKIEDELEELLRDYFNSDTDMEVHLEDFYNGVDEKMKALGNTGKWHAEGRNMGWRNRSGEKNFKADDAKELMQKILPDTDTHVYVYDAEGGMDMTVYHHDSPTGEFYTVKPIPDYSDKISKMMGETQSKLIIEWYDDWQLNVYFEAEFDDGDGGTVTYDIQSGIDVESMTYDIKIRNDDDKETAEDSRIAADLKKYDEVMKELGFTKD
jgi:hypothetical protein